MYVALRKDNKLINYDNLKDLQEKLWSAYKESTLPIEAFLFDVDLPHESLGTAVLVHTWMVNKEKLSKE